MPLRPQVLYPSHAQQHPAVNGGHVAILSAENPRFPAETQGTESLKGELDRLGLDYELTKGKYGAPENSFIVSNPDLPSILDLGRRFGQESVAYSENGRHQLHFVNGPQAGLATNPSEKHQWHNEPPQDNYTAVPGPNGEPVGYFTWNIDFDSPMVPSKPTPMTSQQVAPMAKSEINLAVVQWLERLGELRTRELAKAEAIKGVTVAPGVKPKSKVMEALAGVKKRPTAAPAPTPAPKPAAPAPKGKTFSQAPVDASMTGRAAILGMKKDEFHVLHSRGDTKSYVTKQRHYAQMPSEHTSFPDEASAIAHADDISRRHSEPRSNYTVGKGRGEPMKKVAPTDSDAYFHPSEKGSPKKPAAGPPAQNTYRNVPRDYRKGEDIGSAVAMISGDVHKVKKSEKFDRDSIRRVREAEDKELENVPLRTPNQGQWPQQSGKVPSIAEERQMGKSENSKVDPLDGDMARQKHMCKMCKGEMSPVEAALRKAHGSHVRCENMAKGELKYHNNEPQHGKADNEWKPKCKVVAAPGSGGQIKKNPIGNGSNDGAKSVELPMAKSAITEHLGRMARGAAVAGAVALGTMAGPAQAAGRPAVKPAAQQTRVIQHHAPSGPYAAGTSTPVADVRAEKAPMVSPSEKPPMPIIKAETPGQGEHPAGGRPSKPGAPGPMSIHKAEGMSTPKAPGAGAGMGGGKPAAGGSSPPKVMPLGMGKSELYKSISERAHQFGELRKALSYGGGTRPASGSIQASRQQASFEAGQATGLPAAGKVQPKSPAEYDAAAFRPATPGAAGAPSGLELDTAPKTFAPGASTKPPVVGGMAAKPVSKQGSPIARLTGIRGAPLAKPKI